MNVNLDKQHEQQLREIAAHSGRQADELAAELLAKSLDRLTTSAPATTSLAEAKRIAEQIRALPLEGPDDGFSGRDHDKVLYPSQQ